MSGYDEAALMAEATALLDGDEPVLAAGVFGLAGLLGAATGGTVAGGVVGDELGDVVPAAGVVGAVLGGMAAKRAYAESQGASLQLLVAVTEGSIHVLNRGLDEHLPVELARFDRTTCHVTIKKFGLSRTVHLEDPDTGEGLALTGAAHGPSPLARGDKLVLHLLAD